jgi:Secretion system C-terminal sorting domain
LNQRIGWGYGVSGSNFRNVHTTNGGDTTFLVGLQQISSELPNYFKLFQNYPNPFNPVTKIKYQIISNNSNVELTVFDITGKQIIELVKQKQNVGSYEVDFSGYGYSFGVYFYKLTVNYRKEVFTETKKMILIK